MTTLKPVYLRNRDLQTDNKNYLSDYELLEAVSKEIDDTKCIQRDRDLWRIYVGSEGSRRKLLVHGFDICNCNVRAFETNPYSAGTRSPSESVLKVTVKGVPLSVDDDEILKMLKQFNIDITSDLKFEKIRHPVTRKMTGILNGNRFLYIKELPEGTYLPRTSYCAGLRCQIFHYGQPKLKRSPLCTNCWESTHFRNQCENPKRCKVCKSEGHEPGSELCKYYVKEQENIITTSGKGSIISNFHMCEIDIFGMKHRSAEHAYQYVKAMRCEDVARANLIKDCRTALDAKKIGKLIITNVEFEKQRETLMKEIIEAKAVQVSSFRDALKKSHKSAKFVENTFDDFWGSGIDTHASIHTDCGKWPGKNVFGTLVTELANKYRRPTRSWSTPRQSATNADNQMNLTDMLRDLKTPRKRDSSGRRKSPNKDRMRNSPEASDDENK